ncbi:MAG TPA: L-seryl-tRNA(Sec) selenium transferase [Acidimicrobiales bacterium]|nr:L-seryl-tRNA(Sec) selenium transferase [Acidimicrobiales bacterium]
MTPTSRPPSIDSLARRAAAAVPSLPHPLCVDVARQAVAGGESDRVVELAAALARTLLQPVVNATGVLLHTNLGRAPLDAHSPAGYSNLEFDLASGGRGSRSGHAAALLARLVHAEAALVVNNGAAAVLLVLSALAAQRPVLVSRGELVEIGGGFRIPDVMAASGARLIEVGTTNRTRLADYLARLDDSPALFLKVHPSNYRMTGFVESVGVDQLATAGVPVVVDLGSGLLDAATPWLPDGPPPWLAGEPAAKQTLAAGAALVTFSGDKLLGGPQAGIIAGRADLVAACARHPLSRALRPGGLVLDALQDVALAYLRRDAGRTLPLWRMLTTPVEELRGRAAALGVGRVVECTSVAGGGTLPGVEIPSAGVAVDGDVTGQLRAGEPPIVARALDGSTVCDLRTVAPDEDALVAKALSACTS